MAKEVWGWGVRECDGAGPEGAWEGFACVRVEVGRRHVNPGAGGWPWWLATVSWTVGQPGVPLLSALALSAARARGWTTSLVPIRPWHDTWERLTLDWAPKPCQHPLHHHTHWGQERACPWQGHHCWVAHKRMGRDGICETKAFLTFRINCRFQPVGSHLQFATVVKNSTKQKPSGGAAIMSWILSMSTHI